MGRIAGGSGWRVGTAALRRRVRVLGAVLLLLGACLLPVQGFAAQRMREKAGHAEAVTATRKPQGPLLLIVSIDRQNLRLFDKEGLVEATTVSTGTGGYPTPTGIFAILDKEKTHYSNIYGGASMPYMQRLTMSGVALHSGVVTGRPASHGCIRLPHAYAIRLFGLTKLGVRVIVADEEVSPTSIEHPRLFKPKRAQLAAASGEGTVVPILQEEPRGPAAIASVVAAELQRGVGRAKIGDGTADREAALQALAVSVFVSRETGRVYVRHGFLPLFDAPVTIRDDDRSIGTHVFTAMDTEEDGTRMRWTAVSVRKGAGSSSASEALDRIELPPEIAERIAQMLTVGATLIVSDYGPSREMRPWGTDFVILTK